MTMRVIVMNPKKTEAFTMRWNAKQKTTGTKMGNVTARELADAVGDSEFEFTLEQSILIHLASNLYPPVPPYMVKPCLEALDAVNSGLYRYTINLPEGTSFRGKSFAQAWDIVEGHRLESWVTGPDDVE
jgi:hypothetical protein